MAEDRVTVIPVSNAALRAIKTPYVAFDQSFKERPARLTRQADALDIAGAEIAYAIGDVWPMGQVRPYNTDRMRAFVKEFETFGPAFHTHLWPETILYRTSVIRNCRLNEGATYRPVVEPWIQLRRELGDSLVGRTLLMTEPMIEVEDRMVYPHAFAGPKLVMPDEQCDVSVLIVLDGPIQRPEMITDVFKQTVSDPQVLVAYCGGHAGELDDRLTVVSTPGATRAAALNSLLLRACGRHIALWDPSCTYPADRLEKQLAIDADLVGGPVQNERGLEAYDPIPFCHTVFSGLSYVPQETMLLSRRALDRLGGFDPVLPVQYALDLQLRAHGATDLALAQQREAMACRITDNGCSEYAVYGFYCLFVARDLAAAHFVREAAHRWISFKDIRR